MEDNYYYKEIMINYSLIIILCLFLVVYIVINYTVIQDGNIYGGNISKTVIITGVIFLILYIFLTWEDDGIDKSVNKNLDDREMGIIPKYKITNKIHINENIPDNESKQVLKQENKYNSKYIKESLNNKQDEFIKKLEISDNKIENSNIFVPHKNKAKFGIKF